MLCIAIVISGICIAGNASLIKNSERLIQIIEKAQECAEKGDFEGAAEHSEKAVSIWEKAEPAVSMYVDDRVAETILISVQKLKVYAEQQNKNDFLAEYKNAVYLIDCMLNNEELKFYNIF